MNTTPPAPELIEIFGRAYGYLLTEQTAHHAVDGLAEVARTVIGAAQGAGVSVLSHNGKRLSVGATNEDVLAADDLQYEFGEGPCITARSTGAPVIIEDTHADERWPQWTAAAASSGIRSCLSVPLMRKKEGLGAMKVYSDQPNAFTDNDQRILINLARSASALLGHVQTSDTPLRISDEVKASMTDRDTVGIARGVLMERLGIDKQAAMERLVGLATEENTSVTVIAARLSGRPDGPGTKSGA